jgi:plasmid maintenance system antidote protein VapI
MDNEGLLKNDIVRISNLSYPIIHDLLHANKTQPNLSTVIKLADTFGVQIDEIFNRNDYVVPDTKINAISNGQAQHNLRKFITNYSVENSIRPSKISQNIGLHSDTIKNFVTKGSNLRSNAILLLADHFKISIDEMIGRTIPIKELNILKPLEIISKKTVSSKPSIVGITNISDIENIEKIKAAMTSLSNKSNIDSKSSKPVSHVAKLNASRNKKDDTPSR